MKFDLLIFLLVERLFKVFNTKKKRKGGIKSLYLACIQMLNLVKNSPWSTLSVSTVWCQKDFERRSRSLKQVKFKRLRSCSVRKYFLQSPTKTHYVKWPNTDVGSHSFISFRASNPHSPNIQQNHTKGCL